MMIDEKDLFLDLKDEEQVKEKLQEIVENIKADETFYLENASARYEKANEDYNNERVIERIDSDGESVTLCLPNEEKNLIKRYAGLVVGSKDSIDISPATSEDELFAEALSHFIKFEFKKAKFPRIKGEIANQMKRIGNCYVAIVYDADMYNDRYNAYGVISIELIPYHEMILDLNSRNSYDQYSPYFRNRETRRRRIPLKEAQKIVKQAGLDWWDKIGAYTNDAIKSHEETNLANNDEHAYIYEHTFRERVEGDKGKLKYKYFTVTLINNNPDFVLEKIEESPLEKYNTIIFTVDERSDTPYNSGYMEETLADREEQAELREAKRRALRAAVKNKTFVLGLSPKELSAALDTSDNNIVGIEKAGVKIIEVGNNAVSDAFAQAEADIKLTKQEKGGEFDIQSGRQPFSSTTGKLANVLNSRSDLGKVQDVLALEDGFEDLINIYLEIAIENYDMPLIVQRLSEDGSGRITGALEIMFSSFKATDARRRFDVNVTMDLNSDNTKAQANLIAQNNRDILAPLDILKMTGAKNPDLLHRNWAKHQGLLDMFEFVQQNPNAMEMFERLKQQTIIDQQQAQLAQQQLAKNPLETVVNE